VQTGLKFPERELDLALFKVVKLGLIVVVQYIGIGIVIVQDRYDVMVDRGDRGVDAGFVFQQGIEHGRGVCVSPIHEALVVHEEFDGRPLLILRGIGVQTPYDDTSVCPGFVGLPVLGVETDLGLPVGDADVLGHDEIKGEDIVSFVVLKPGFNPSEELRDELKGQVVKIMGKTLKPRDIKFVSDLSKTRSAKIVRRIIKASYLGNDISDTSSVENLNAIDEIKKAK